MALNPNKDILSALTNGTVSNNDDLEYLYLMCTFSHLNTDSKHHNAKWFFDHLNWADHVKFIHHKDRDFNERYHMYLQAFDIICDILQKI